MGNIDEGGLQLLVQLGDLGTHLHAQLGVQVGQRLVHQEHLGFTHDGAAQGDTLALTAGQRGRLAVQQRFNAQDGGSFLDATVDVSLGHFAQLQAEGHVVVNRHMRIQGVALEHHRDIAILRGNMVDQLVVDVQFTLGDILQTGDHAQGGGLAAAGRPDQDDKLFILDLQVEIAHGDDITGINLVYTAKGQTCHVKLPPQILFRIAIITDYNQKVNGAITQKDGEGVVPCCQAFQKSGGIVIAI